MLPLGGPRPLPRLSIAADGPHIGAPWDVSAHQFRHGMASTLYAAGVGEMEAQRILGHASITTTHEVYTHLRQAQLSAAADRLNDFISTGS